MITVWPGRKYGNFQPYSITIDNQIFFITHDEDSDKVGFNCFVDEGQEKKLKEILKYHLTNGKNVLY